MFKEKQRKKASLCLETDFKTPREKEDIYKEFERYDEKYSHLKPEINCGETKETKNRGKIFKQVNILYIFYLFLNTHILDLMKFHPFNGSRIHMFRN